MALWIGRSESWGYEFAKYKRGFDDDLGFCKDNNPGWEVDREIIKLANTKLKYGEVRKIKSIKIELEV